MFGVFKKSIAVAAIAVSGVGSVQAALTTWTFSGIVTQANVGGSPAVYGNYGASIPSALGTRINGSITLDPTIFDSQLSYSGTTDNNAFRQVSGSVPAPLGISANASNGVYDFSVGSADPYARSQVGIYKDYSIDGYNGYNGYLFNITTNVHSFIMLYVHDSLGKSSSIFSQSGFDYDQPVNWLANGATTEARFYTGNEILLANIDSVTVSAVPEPETYAMMLAGLALVGAFTRRRKAKQARQA